MYFESNENGAMNNARELLKSLRIIKKRKRKIKDSISLQLKLTHLNLEGDDLIDQIENEDEIFFKILANQKAKHSPN